jgi:hypothetical protein
MDWFDFLFFAFIFTGSSIPLLLMSLVFTGNIELD